MQQCPNCHVTQQQGKFCAKCGTETVFVEQAVEQKAPKVEAIPVQQTVQQQAIQNVQVKN